MIEITAAAAREIERLQRVRSQQAAHLCLQVVPGGCCELAYTFSFEARPQETTFSSQGITISVVPESLVYLQNLKIDYSEDLMGGGFRFTNPNAMQTCSCSQSFSLS